MNELWKLDIQDFFQAQIPKFDLQVAGYLNDLVKEWTKIYSFIFNLEIMMESLKGDVIL